MSIIHKVLFDLEKKGPSLKSTLADTPDIGMMTDKGAEWSQQTQKTEGEADKEKEEEWAPTPEWVETWKKKLPLQTIMRVLQVIISCPLHHKINECYLR